MDIEVKSLDYSTVESAICSAYDLGCPGSSNFTELQEGKSQNITIAASKGVIKCDVRANRIKNFEMYLISIGCVKVSKKKN